MQSAGLTPDGLDAWPASGFVGVKAIYALYPYCGFPALSRRYAWPESPPIESVLIKNDSVTNETASEAVYHRQVKNGANIQWHMIEGVTHGFDEPDHHPASVLKYDAKETHKMEVKLLNFLKRHLG